MDRVITPTLQSDTTAGCIVTPYDCIVKVRDKLLWETDLQIAVPWGSYGRIAPRSGLATKKFINVGVGVVDISNRGNVGVLLFNFSKKDVEIKRGDRIAQLICECIYYPNLIHCTKGLDKTDRGEKGFGSSGC